MKEPTASCFAWLRKAGDGWKPIGVSLIAAAFVVPSLLQYHSESALRFFVVSGLAAAFYSFGKYCFSRGRKVGNASAEEILETDRRPPVLYLRSFVDDQVTAKHIKYGRNEVLTTEEEDLAAVMNEVGPFIAIGKPGETLPDLGAARAYCGDAEWQETVATLMAQAGMVVLRVGWTENLWWELQKAVEQTQPNRLLLLLPFKYVNEYNIFRTKAEQYLPCRLPQFKNSRSPFTITSFIHFDPDWRAQLVPISYPYRVRICQSLRERLKIAIRPVFEQIGIHWKPPSSTFCVIMALFYLTFFFFGLLHFCLD